MRSRSLAVAFVSLAVACGDEAPSVGGFAMTGPIQVTFEQTDNFVLFHPEDVASQDSWPAVVWFNGASGYQDDFNYNGLLESIASWGFIVLGGKSSGMNPGEADQRTELFRRNAESADVLFGRIDEDRIAVVGHSLGGIQTTMVAAAYHVAVAIQGALPPEGTAAPPTLYMTSEADDVIPPAGIISAYRAAAGPAWLANHSSANHNDPRTDGGVYREPLIAFLRWRMMDDRAGAEWFDGDACVLCAGDDWSFEASP